MTASQTAVQKTPAAPGVTFAEIEQLVREVLPVYTDITQGAENLGAYAPGWRWLAAAQGVAKPTLRHPRMALFSAGGADAVVVEDIAKGRHAIARIAAEANADLQVYELGSEAPAAGALTEGEAAHAFSYGLMAVQLGIDLLTLAALSAGSAATAEKLQAALKAGTPPLNALAAAGTLEVCAMAGAIAAARLAKVPVLLDGAAAHAAAAVLTALRADAAAHCFGAENLLPEALPATPGLAGAMLVPLLKAVAAAGA